MPTAIAGREIESLFVYLTFLAQTILEKTVRHLQKHRLQTVRHLQKHSRDNGHYKKGSSAVSSQNHFFTIPHIPPPQWWPCN